MRIRKIAKSDSSLHYICLSACLSVRPSLRMEQRGSHWTDFREIRALSQISIQAKLQIGDRGQKQLTGRSPLRWRRCALDCSAI